MLHKLGKRVGCTGHEDCTQILTFCLPCTMLLLLFSRDRVVFRALLIFVMVFLFKLNLASQSVLEGLNACLDHRAEVSLFCFIV